MSIITRIYNHVYDFPVFPQIRCMVRHDENRTEYETLLKDFQAMATYNFFYLKAERNFQWVCQGHLCFKWITTCSTEFRIMHRLPLQRRPTTPNYSLVLAASLLFCSEGNDSASSTRHQMSIAHSSFAQMIKWRYILTYSTFPLQYPIIAGRIRVVSHGRVIWNGQNLFKASCIIQDNSTAVPIDLLGAYGATVYGKSRSTPPNHFFILAGVYRSKEEWKFAMRKS